MARRTDWSRGSGRDGLALAKEIYGEAFEHADELCAPYATVIDIDPARLPTPGEVRGWSSEQYTSALRHEREAAAYKQQPASTAPCWFQGGSEKWGARFIRNLLEANETVIAKNVTENLLTATLHPYFSGAPAAFS